jgi:hypothetical protein
MQAYARENIGRKSASHVLTEEDSCRDLLLILELLTSIASKNFLDKVSLGTGEFDFCSCNIIGTQYFRRLWEHRQSC